MTTFAEMQQHWGRTARRAGGISLAASPHPDALVVDDFSLDKDARLPAVVYVPGRWGSPGCWAIDRPERDLRVWLAGAGHPLVTVRFRTCGLGEAEAARYRTNDFLEDIAVAVDVTRELFPGRAIALCGYSMGATLSFLSAGVLSIAGLIALDGGLPSESLLPISTSDAVENPHLHPRAVRAALSHLAAHREDDPDLLRWRLTQDRWWPSAQIDEIRTSCYADGLRVEERLALVNCPILAVAADDRDPPTSWRAIRTAARTSASEVYEVVLADWTHEEVATRFDSRLAAEVLAFLSGLK